MGNNKNEIHLRYCLPPWSHRCRERVITSHFSADSDDIFMRSMIKNYAHEKRTAIEELDDGTKIGGEPTGSFWMGKKDMERASKEVLKTHKGLSGDALATYMETYFPRTW